MILFELLLAVIGLIVSGAAYIWGIFFAGSVDDAAEILFWGAAFSVMVTGLVVFILINRIFKQTVGMTVLYGGLPTLFYLPLSLLFFPSALFLADQMWGAQLFDPACGAARVPDYFLLAADGLVKGFALDFMESFHIDLFSCRANPDSVVASTFVFLMRCFTSYVLVFAIVQIYTMRMGRRDLSIGWE